MERGLKRGPKPKKIIDDTWRPDLAYAIGLLASDGCLSNNGLLIDLTSNDREQLENYSKCLGVSFKISEKSSGGGRRSLRVQFKNRIFYDFLLSIGLTKKKSLTLGQLAIPEEYFFDFLRGCFDGDGCSYSYWDPRWKSSFMFYVGFTSASKNFIDWIREEIKNRIEINGHTTESKRKNHCYQIKYAKYEGIKLVQAMYKNKKCICLTRKKLKINECLGTMGVPPLA
ncbi:MAG: hypothetical protein NTV02_01980 [Candidatus Zambryskibacteria bacterium]|nr:hypothetical protein [Candidatus Zambryskibacteria bacterium]